MNRKTAIKQFLAIKKLKGNMRLAAEKWPAKFQTLIATILSARSLDETTIKTCKILFSKYPDASSLAKSNSIDIEKIIKPINFYKNKTKSIINCAKVLNERYNGKIPQDYEKLIELSGVGAKTANVFLSELGKDSIAVDTHVYYISRYLRWSNSNKPEQAEKDLKKLFPKKYWNKLNPTLVRFGKKYTSRKEKNLILDKIKKIK
ncbi:MAG: endonuclease III [Nanoarchaeota archaeon]